MGLCRSALLSEQAVFPIVYLGRSLGGKGADLTPPSWCVASQIPAKRVRKRYLDGVMPPWVRRTLNKELLTPLVKAAPPSGREPDCRPAKGQDTDISGWAKGQQRKHCKEVSRQLTPQQLAIGVPDGIASRPTAAT